jgi:hypothetical protein
MSERAPGGADTIFPAGKNLIHEIVGVPGYSGFLGEAGVPLHPAAPHEGSGGRLPDQRGRPAVGRGDRGGARAWLGEPEASYGRVFQAKNPGAANAIEVRIPVA